jgi:hypothetical protein
LLDSQLSCFCCCNHRGRCKWRCFRYSMSYSVAFVVFSAIWSIDLFYAFGTKAFSYAANRNSNNCKS